MSRLILASASPRRAELLHTAGFDFEACPVSVDESPRFGEDGIALVMRLAQDKATACLQDNPGIRGAGGRYHDSVSSRAARQA